MVEQARDVLNRYWGYPSFRPLQEEIISTVVASQDVLALLPTGGGKSICYQVPGIMLGGITLVVSPLIALMQDQVGALMGRGIGSFALTGYVEPAVFSFVIQKAQQSPHFFIYAAPEKLKSKQVQQLFETGLVRLIAVDEAHCISSWGHDFRPSYRQIADLRTQFPQIPICAVTATATPTTVNDILNNLKMRDGSARVVRGSFDRPNIELTVLNMIDARGQVIDLISTTKGAVIVYSSTRVGVNVWTEKLNRSGIPTVGYHAGMATTERERAQRVWLQRKMDVIVATNAFGMGIDRPDVRLVIHVGIPGSIEAYYQEAGRAGRDGKAAKAYLLVTPEGLKDRRALVRGKRSRRLFKHMERLVERPMCRKWGILGYFGETAPEQCETCDYCRTALSTTKL